MPPKTSDAEIEAALRAFPDTLDLELSRGLHVGSGRVRDVREALGIPQPLRFRGLSHRVTDAQVDAELLRDPSRSDCQIAGVLNAAKAAELGRPVGLNPIRVLKARVRLGLAPGVFAVPGLSVAGRGQVPAIEALLREDHLRSDVEIAALAGNGCTPSRVYAARSRLGLRRPRSAARPPARDPRIIRVEEELRRDAERHDTAVAAICDVNRASVHAARKRLGLPRGPDNRHTPGGSPLRLWRAGPVTVVSPRGVTPKRLSGEPEGSPVDEERGLSRCLDPGSDKSWDPTAGRSPGRDLSAAMPQLPQQEQTAVVTHTPEPAAEVLAREVAAALGLPTSAVAAMAPVPGMSAVAVGSARVLRPLPAGLPLEGVYREALVRQLVAAVTQSDEFHGLRVSTVQEGLGLDPTTLRRNPRWSRRRR